MGADANPCRLGVADALEWGTKSEVGAQRLHNPWPPGVPDASKRGTKPEVAQKWAQWLHNPYRVGRPRRFKVADNIVAHKWAERLHNTMPPEGSPTLQGRGTKSEVAHKWAGRAT